MILNESVLSCVYLHLFPTAVFFFLKFQEVLFISVIVAAMTAMMILHKSEANLLDFRKICHKIMSLNYRSYIIFNFMI